MKQTQKQTVIVKIGDVEKKKKRRRKRKSKRPRPPPAQPRQTFAPVRYNFVPQTFPASRPDPLRQQAATHQMINNPLSQRSSYRTLLQPPPGVIASQTQIEERIRASQERASKRVQEKEDELRRQNIGAFGGGSRRPVVAEPLKLDSQRAEDQLPEVHSRTPHTRYSYQPTSSSRTETPITPLDIRNERRLSGSGRERTTRRDQMEATDLNTLLGAV